MPGTAKENLVKQGISADSHIVEPPNCYVDFIDPKYRDVAPYIAKNKYGVDNFMIKGLKNGVPLGLMAAAGIPQKDLDVQRTVDFDDLVPGSWNPKVRLGIQDEDGICAEMIYASVGMVLCGLADYEYQSACFSAYNRWLQTFCGEAPNRLFGLAQTSVSSVDEAIEDFCQAKELGMYGMMMTGNPQYEDYDHPDYDALWQCAVDLELPICFHILTIKGHDVKTAFRPERGHAANGFVNIIRGVQNIMGLFVFGGVFERFPGLKMVIAEGDAGWLPHYMYRVDHAVERFGAGLDDIISQKPSEYIRNNIWFTFQDDRTAYDSEELVNSNKLLWANDYPHNDSTYPRSQQILQSQMTHLTETQKNAVVHDNVKALFNLPITDYRLPIKPLSH
jgi:predicted TIM-barrel fold metal-dependent hydrolase